MTNAEFTALEREFLKFADAQNPTVMKCSGSIRMNQLLAMEILQVQKMSLFNTKPWFLSNTLTATYYVGHALTAYHIYQWQ